jgi:uncharacterized protein YggT (Ycf19 family)
MTLLDLILNLAGLLMWLSWCARRFDPLTRTVPATLIGTVKPAESRPVRGWQLLVGLAALLVARAVFYYEIGSAVGWTPRLDFGVVVLAFRSDKFGPVCLYTLISFGKVLIVYYFWLLTLVLINWRVAEPDPLQKLLRLQLSKLTRWPWPVLGILPVLGVMTGWLLVYPLLVRAGVVTPADSIGRLLEQGLLLSATLALSLKYLLPVILLVHATASYVYLGASPVWDFFRTTSQHLLKPLAPLRLRVGKVDLAPLAGVIVILFLLHWGPQLLEAELASRHVVIWPQ